MNKVLMLKVFLLSILFSPTVTAQSVVTVKVYVEDESLHPISNALVTFSFSKLKDSKDPWKGTTRDPIALLTDKNGKASASKASVSEIALGVEKVGYYQSREQVPNMLYDEANRKWVYPKDRDAKIFLRKIMNPIPMYAWGMYKLDYPVKENEWVGYDMLQAEWMPPHGKGLTEDVQMCVVCNIGKRDYEKVPLSVVSIRFLGKHNGVTGIPDQSVCEQSWLQLPYSAPRDGYMTQEFTTSHFVTLEGDVERHVMNTGTTNCFFRIRSSMDKDGRFIEGLYGKMPGLVKIGNGGPHNISLDLKYYVNPTPNDLNMEWNPKCNLVPKKEAYKVLVYP